MNRNERLIIDILRSSINKEEISIEDYKKTDWEFIFRESEQHQISSLIYFLLSASIKKRIDKNIIDNWKRQVVVYNVRQKLYFYKVEKILLDLKNKNIQVIALKGSVLRNYYPKPELRSMSDVDFLVTKENYNAIKQYLINHGYKSTGCYSDIHEEFVAKDNFEIELHCKLVNNDYIYHSNTIEFENSVFKNLIDVKMNNIVVKTMNIENFLIHLCFHMAVHVKTQGIGLRQLYDVAAFIKKNNEHLNWNKLYKRLLKYRILKFAKGIFIIVNYIFNVNCPKEFLYDSELTKSDTDLLLKNILLSGVYGRKVHVEGFESLYGGIDNKNYRYIKIKRFIKLLFPPKKYMKTFYEEANRKATILPLDWLYRINIIFLRKYGLKNSVKYIKEAYRISDMRTNIIQIFEL